MTARLLKIGLPFAIAAFFLWRFLAGLDPAEVVRAAAGIRLLPLAAGFAIGVGVLFLRAWRWQRLIRAVGHVPILPLYHATAVGFAASVLLPARAGEVVRPLLVARQRNLPVSGLLASVVVERLLDLVAIISLFLFSVFLPKGLVADPSTRANMARASSFTLLALAALVGGLLLLTFFGEKFIAATLGRMTFLPVGLRAKLDSFARHCLDGLVALRDPRNLAIVLAQTVFIWIVIDLQVWCSLQAFSFDVPFRSTFLVVAFGALGLAVGTPGGVGSFHKTTQMSVELYGVATNSAAAFAVVHHLACFIPILVVGFVSLFIEGMSWSALRTMAAESSDEPPPATGPVADRSEAP